jgi:NADH-quinone oxidoreductase subunit N
VAPIEPINQFRLEDIPRLLPELMLILVGLMVLLSDIVDRWGSDPDSRAARLDASWRLALAGLGIVLVVVLVQSRYLFTFNLTSENLLLDRLYSIVRNLQAAGPGGPPLLGMFATDNLTTVARILLVGTALLAVLLTSGQPPAGNPGEFYALLLLSTAGMCLMAGSTDLILAYLSLELSSLALYVLAGYFHDDQRSSEAGLKYFLFGVLSSGILLYGMSLAYGYVASKSGAGQAAVGTLLSSVGRLSQTAGGPQPLLTLALLFIVAGLGYKITAVPFHSWAPDVYQGAPTTVTAFIATASKTAGFLLLFRLLTTAFPGQAGDLTVRFGGWSSLLAITALATLVVGNFSALPQHNARRLLAYSSIGHAGFMLLGVILWGSASLGARNFATASLLYYLVAYSLMTLGAFGTLAAITQAVGGDELSDLDGLARRNLPMALLMTVLILSLAGVPPLAGFWAKFFVFMAAYQAGAVWLVAVAVAMMVVALSYYLRFLKAMWFNPPADETPIRVPRSFQATLVLASALVLLLGIFPNLIWSLLDRATVLAAAGI